MNAELTKNLTDLIDETMAELEDLKKSRFAAAEMEIKGPGEGIAGKPSNGELEAKKAEEEHEEDEEEKEDKAEKADHDEKDEDEAKKAEYAKKADHDDPADKPETKRKLKALLGKAEEEEEHEEEEHEEEKEEKKMKKSEQEISSLMKSYVDERVKPMEAKLTEIFSLVEKIANQPMAPKGVTAKAVPLMKSADEGHTPLSKADVASKLFDLKKSGTNVDSVDIVKADLGQDLEKIVKKYRIS
jgi:hypothetical protein